MDGCGTKDCGGCWREVGLLPKQSLNQIADPVVTDEELIARLRQGDRAAFDAIYQRYFKRIYHFLDKRLRNSADTEEVVQEVFINVFSSIESFRGESPFAAWIFGLTRRTLANRFKRKRHPMVPLSDSDAEILPTGTGGICAEPSPLEQYEYQERLSQMSDALENRLSSEQRQLFEMHHLESVPIGQIAETLSKSEDAVKSNLYRARKLLLAR